MRALHLQTFGGQFRFLGEKIVGERVSYFGVREKQITVFALQSPSSHRPDTNLKTTDGTPPGNTLIDVSGQYTN